MKKMALLFLLVFFHSIPALANDFEAKFSPEDLAYKDVFMGTLEIKDGRPLLVRCTGGRYEYLLVNNQGSSEEYLRQLKDLKVDQGEIVQATVGGTPLTDGDTLLLLVISIADIKPGTCHLSDFFKSMAPEGAGDQ